MKTYTTRAKDDWGSGPWQHEPDKMSWTDPDTDLPCLIVRNPGGALCGYVGVEPGHPWHGISYGEHIGESCGAEWCYEHTPEGIIDVHGGITYSGPCAHSDDEAVGICHVPDPGRSDDVWWFGFDCAHYMDLCPGDITSRQIPIAGETYRDVPYVQNEVRKMARQLAGVAA